LVSSKLANMEGCGFGVWV